jgi:hypothetical protein
LSLARSIAPESGAPAIVKLLVKASVCGAVVSSPVPSSAQIQEAPGISAQTPPGGRMPPLTMLASMTVALWPSTWVEASLAIVVAASSSHAGAAGALYATQ